MNNLIFRHSAEISGNFDDEYVSTLICQNKGSLSVLDDYLNKLAVEILLDEYNPIKSDYISNLAKKFDIENSSDISALYSVISKIANKFSVASSVKHLTGENLEELTKENNKIPLKQEVVDQVPKEYNFIKNDNDSKKTDSEESIDNTFIVKGVELSSLINDFLDKSNKIYDDNLFLKEEIENFNNFGEMFSNVFLQNERAGAGPSFNQNNMSYPIINIGNNNSYNNMNQKDLNLFNVDNLLSSNSFQEVVEQLKMVENFGTIKEVVEKMVIHNIIEDFLTSNRSSSGKNKRQNNQSGHRKSQGKFKNLMKKYYKYVTDNDEAQEEENSNNALLNKKLQRNSSILNSKK